MVTLIPLDVQLEVGITVRVFFFPADSLSMAADWELATVGAKTLDYYLSYVRLGNLQNLTVRRCERLFKCLLKFNELKYTRVYEIGCMMINLKLF